MRNGQLKPGYNVQIGTENQFIVSYSLHQRPTDTRCLKPHLEKVKAALGKLPGTVIADAGYGGEENYAYLEQEEVQAIIKYSTYHKEKSKKWQTDISKIDNWHYDEETDTWTCPGGQTLDFRYESTQEKLRSEEGYALSVRRMIEPESVFGQMKNNRNFRRFLLRRLPKVSLEVGWLSLAHNLLKWAAMNQKGRVREQVWPFFLYGNEKLRKQGRPCAVKNYFTYLVVSMILFPTLTVLNTL
nr:transposase [Paenibacillus naphthalenovorans]